MKLNKNGYLILKNVFSKEEIQVFKQEVQEYIAENNNKLFKSSGGISIPDFINHPNSKYFKTLKQIKDNPQIHEKLQEIFDTSNNYRFCGHNDIGINRTVGWHKDKLNNEYAKYETVNIWKTHNDQQHEIVKVLIYLEDHIKDNHGLKLIPESHFNSKLEVNKKKVVQLHPEIGDVIIFDQRITHRGQEKKAKGTRILVAFGFGKNNIFTDNFEKGTIARQNKQKN